MGTCPSQHPTWAGADRTLPVAYLEATYLISRFLQVFGTIELARDAQPRTSWMEGRQGDRIMPEAPVLTLSLRGGVWLRFRQKATL